MRLLRLGGLVALACLVAGGARAGVPAAAAFDVRAYGARGDGKAVDSPAVNRAIAAAAAAGGGTVAFPAGTYLCFSIRLQSHITLYLGPGATILAAKAGAGLGAYDVAEPNEAADMYQDFGHSHWHTGLIWGENLVDVAIVGPGLIDGAGLTRFGPGPRRPRQASDTPLSLGARKTAGNAEFPPGTEMAGQGDKAIALKSCRGVTLRDFSIRRGGHFAVLATGLDQLTIENLKIDTNRDALDLDCCCNVRVADCTINTPNDDAITLKSSYALGFPRACENVTITGCQVSGYDEGTVLDGTYGTTQQLAPDRDGVTGRIKFGTESNGGLRNCTIANCVFVHCRGFALEAVDGGAIEDITVTNLTMRGLVNSPFFIRLGDRQRAPEGSPISTVRRITISHLVASDVDPRYPAEICGIAGHPIEDVNLSDIRILYRGGGTREQAETEAPERDNSYPEPSMFGVLPAYGLFVRHVRNLTVDHLEVGFVQDDQRPAILLGDVTGASFDHLRAQHGAGIPVFRLRRIADFSVRASPGVEDASRFSADRDAL
jgi:polygalacturonase